MVKRVESREVAVQSPKAVSFGEGASGAIAKMFNNQKAAKVGGALWPYVSTRGGQFEYNKVKLGHEFEGVIIGVAFENRYYESAYNPAKKSTPSCFAIVSGDDDDALENMKPHASVPSPESTTCAECPQNAWESDPKGGRGKACKNQRRLIVLSKSKNYAKAEGVRIGVPVTSVKNLANYTKLLESVGVPLAAVLTRFKLFPLDGGGHGMDFEFAAEDINDCLIDDEAQLEAIVVRAEAGRESLLMPPQVAEIEDDAPRGKQEQARIKVEKPKPAAPARKLGKRR